MTEQYNTSLLLQKHFDTALETPDGIKKLRALILTLAMQGKLVPQNPADQPTSELLKEIAEEKKRLIKEGKIRKQEPLPVIKDSEIPYEVPDGWEWVRLGEFTEIIRGITFPSLEKTKEKALGRIACLRTTNVQNDIEWDDLLFIDRKFMNSESKLLRLNDLVISMANSRELVGKVAIINTLPHDEATFGGFLSIIRTMKIKPVYLLHIFKSIHVRTRLIGSASQTTNIANISLGILNPLLIPIPPLAEQHRIVAKIDQLMALCDELEKLRNSRDEKRLTVHTSAINRLLSAPDSESFAASWNFITAHFDELYSVRENVADLKKAILQLAVMGKLVPQDPADQPASELLKEIAEEKKRLVKEGKIRKQENNLSSGSFPYKIPIGWTMVSFNELGYFIGGKTPSTNKSIFWNGTIPWVSSKDMKKTFINDTEDHVTELGIKSGLMIIPIHSILMVVRSGILRRTFPVAINIIPCTINQDLKALIPIKTELSEYILCMLKGFEIYILSHLSKKGMTVESITFQEFTNHKFPYPPLAEQHRIVAKIDQLMALCDELDKQIIDATEKKSAILNAVLAGI